MKNTLVQADRFVFHLTHMKNIPSILKNGILNKKNCSLKRIKLIDVSHENIQDVRATIVIPDTDYTLHDCVPMFFGARPPMLYAVLGKGFNQEDMVYALVSWDIIGNPDVWFTDGNARSDGTTFYQSKADLCKIDFDAAAAIFWHNMGNDYRRKKQAEVLKLGRVDLDDVLGFAVYNKDAKKKLQDMLEAQNISKRVFIVSEFYY